MQKLKLITEASYDVAINEGKGGDLYITGIFSTAELENANGRKYRFDTLKREVDKVQESYLGKNLPFWGELGHPKTPEPNLDRIAIRTTMLEWKGNNLFGKAKVLDTAMGKEAQILLREGPIGVSSRGLGTVNEDGYVNDATYRLLAYDLVGNPSNHPSFVKGIYEAQEFVIYDEGYKPAGSDIKVMEDTKKEVEEGCLINLQELTRAWRQMLKEGKADPGLMDSLVSLKEAATMLFTAAKTAGLTDPKKINDLRRQVNTMSKQIRQLGTDYLGK